MRRSVRLSELRKPSKIEMKLPTDDSELGLEIRQFPNKGRGIATKVSFKKGSFLVEYAGELIDHVSAKKREEEYARDASKGSFMFYFTHNGVKLCIDATEENGRFGRLINHSKKTPNCIPKVITTSI
jgi:histone-lysine N-methyltransferase SETD8